MPSSTTILIHENVIIQAGLTAESLTGPMNRSNLNYDVAQVYPLDFERFRVWDAYQTILPSVGAADDIGLTAAAFGTGCPYLKSRDLNAAGAITTEYARISFTLPPEYIAAAAVELRLAAGMLTSVASVTATVDAEVYLSGRTTLISGTDLCATVAQSCNSLTFAELLFTITATTLSPGSVLDIRLAIAANSATASSHFIAIAQVELLLNVKG